MGRTPVDTLMAKAAAKEPSLGEVAHDLDYDICQALARARTLLTGKPAKIRTGEHKHQVGRIERVNVDLTGALALRITIRGGTASHTHPVRLILHLDDVTIGEPKP